MEICNVSCVGVYCTTSPIYLCRAWVRYILNFDRIGLINEFFSCSICNLFVYSLKIFSIIMSNSLWYILAESSSIFLILFVCCSSLLEYDLAWIWSSIFFLFMLLIPCSSGCGSASLEITSTSGVWYFEGSHQVFCSWCLEGVIGWTRGFCFSRAHICLCTGFICNAL